MSNDGANAYLFAFRLSDPDSRDALALCRMILGSPIWRDTDAENLNALQPSVRTLGSIDAVELFDPSRGVVVRTAVVASGEAYAMAFHTVDTPLDGRALRLFDRVCDSVDVR